MDSAELTRTAPDTLAGGRRTVAWGKNRHSLLQHAGLEEAGAHRLLPGRQRSACAIRRWPAGQEPEVRPVLQDHRERDHPRQDRHLRRQRRGRCEEHCRRGSGMELRPGTLRRSHRMAAPALEDPGAVEERDPQEGLLYRAVSHVARPGALRRRRWRLPRHGRRGPQAARRRAQLHHLLAVGHLPRRAPGLHAHRAPARAAVREHPAAHGGAESRRNARMAAAGHRDRHDDRLPLRIRHLRGLQQGLHRRRLGARLQADDEARHGR